MELIRKVKKKDRHFPASSFVNKQVPLLLPLHRARPFFPPPLSFSPLAGYSNMISGKNA